MDSVEVKRRGRKPREVAAPEVAVVAPAVAADEPVRVEIVPAQPVAPAAPDFVIPIPVWLRDSAIPLNEQIPADIRQAAQSLIGCVVRFKSGHIHAADGRVFRAELNGDSIEVFGG